MSTAAATDLKRPLISPLNQRRLANFKKNRRGYYSFWLFIILFVVSLFSEFIATTSRCWFPIRGSCW